MPKAKTFDRIELTRQKMAAREALKHCKTNEEAKANSPFIKMREQMMHEHPEEFQDEHSCPICGGELIRYEGCYRCKKCSWCKC